MTAATLHTHAASERPAWRALLWMVPLTAAWVVLNYAVPILSTSGVVTTAARLFVQVLIALGLWLGLERTDLTPSQRRNVWLGVMIPFTLWAAIVWSAAISGVFRPGASPFPLLPVAIFLPVIIGTPILLWSRRLGQVLDAMPASWLVALQTYRLFGSVFLVGWARGLIPGIFALPASIGDMLTGLLAVSVALALSSGREDGRRAALAWNVFGLTDFAIAVSIALMIAPGPFLVIVPNVPNTTSGIYPTVLIPAFSVPSSILLHVLSLRQLRRRAR
jgi:hypothetical protein